MTARLLFVGDIHLGRRPSRLPDDLDEHGVTPAELSPATAWRASVERAIALGVDAVVLTGDVVDRLEDRFEAAAPLRSGAQRLVDAGVAVFGVAGNHDVDALPRLARQIPAFTLLGQRGTWETARVPTRSGVGVRLLGWSFPSERVRQSPLDSLRLEAEPGVATLGVLHCDVDAGASTYAPVTRSSLRSAAVDAWLLGHIHRPDLPDDDRPIGYCGSLVGLHPGEPGRHGPWLVEVDGPGRVRAEQLALAPLRYERVDVEIAASPHDASPEDVQDEVFGALTRGLCEVAERVAQDDDEGRLRVVACRIVLSGPGRHGLAARAVLDRPERYPTESRDGKHFFVETVEERAKPDLDLDAIAVGDDPPALLARRLIALQRGGPDAEALVAQARRRLDAALSAPRWQRVSGPPGSDAGGEEALVETLLRAGTRRLEALLDQRAGRTGRSPLAGAQPGAER